MRNSSRTVGIVACLAIAGCSGGGASPGSASPPGGQFPGRDLTLIAASDPGGGLDLASRAVTEALTGEELLKVGIQVEGIGGGGGNPARAALLNRPADGYTVVAESNRVFLNPLTGTTDIQPDKFVPIAKLMTEYIVWATKSDSQWKSAEGVLEALKKDPGSVSFGVGTVPSDDQFNILRPVEEAGIDASKLSLTAFSGGGDLITNFLGGRVDVISIGAGDLSGMEKKGVRVLAVSSAEPQGGILDGVPTWKSLGFSYTLDHWRGVFGPADMPDAAVKWWSTKLEEMSTTKTWLGRLKKNGWTPDFQGSDEFAKTVSSQQQDAQKVISELGLGK